MLLLRCAPQGRRAWAIGCGLQFRRRALCDVLMMMRVVSCICQGWLQEASLAALCRTRWQGHTHVTLHWTTAWSDASSLLAWVVGGRGCNSPSGSQHAALMAMHDQQHPFSQEQHALASTASADPPAHKARAYIK